MKATNVGLVVIVAAAGVSVSFVSALRPSGGAAFLFFAAWLLMPYVVMGVALFLLQRRGQASGHWSMVAGLVSAGGVLFLASVVSQPDAQGAIAVLMAPIFQAVALGVSVPVVLWISRSKGEQ